MYFTKAQMRALWFVVLVFAAAVGYHYLSFYLRPGPLVDFNEFEQEFIRIRDSLAQTIQTDSSGLVADQSKMAGTDQSIILQRYPVNINTANRTQLQELPRIGPAMAERIITYRRENGPFTSPEDLMNIKGIGHKTYEKLKGLVVVE